MTYNYGRYHQDGLGEYNYQFMQPEGDKVPADNFFANFNWDKAKMITLLQLPTGLVVILMTYLQVWNCNRVVPTRPRSNGMTF